MPTNNKDMSTYLKINRWLNKRYRTRVILHINCLRRKEIDVICSWNPQTTILEYQLCSQATSHDHINRLKGFRYRNAFSRALKHFEFISDLTSQGSPLIVPLRYTVIVPLDVGLRLWISIDIEHCIISNCLIPKQEWDNGVKQAFL